MLTSPNGNCFQTKLPLGGFGISRYQLDHLLFSIATSEGVVIFQQSKVESVLYNEGFYLTINRPQPVHVISRLCIGSFGKRSNLDLKWKRSFLDHHDRKLQNFIGVKYHIRSNWPENMIGLHNFQNGYCGISKIEDDKYCLCYLVHADNLKLSGGQITKMEKQFLHKNIHLKKIWDESEFLEPFPVTISQVSFRSKSKIENHILMTGDAGGMITPLCGNGMSIALHTGKIAAELGTAFLKNKLSRELMEIKFEQSWKKNFESRLRNGRILQRFFGSSALSNGFVNFFSLFPFLASPVIRQTHGKPY
jgi:menaquinone-9 beta-reductase